MSMAMNTNLSLPPSNSSAAELLCALLDLVRDPARAQEHIRLLADHERAARHAIQQANEALSASQKAKAELEAERVAHADAVQSAHGDLHQQRAAFSKTVEDERAAIEIEKQELLALRQALERERAAVAKRIERIQAAAA